MFDTQVKQLYDVGMKRFVLLFVLFFILVSFSTIHAASHPISQTSGPILPAQPLPMPETHPSLFVPNQLIITYNPGLSPQQIKEQIIARKKITSSPLGYITTIIQVFSGQIPPLSFYVSSLSRIENVQKKAQVISQENIALSGNSQIVKITIQNGVNLDSTIQAFKKLPEVKSVEKNRYKYTTGSQIASDESNSNIVPNKYIIQYAPGQSPQEIQWKVDNRTQSVSSVLGQARIAAEDAGTALTGDSTAEQTLQQIDRVTEAVGQKNETPLLKQTPELPADLKNTYVVKTDGQASTADTISAYQSIPGVVSVEPVRYVFATNTPNDAYFNQQWDMRKIQAPTAWDSAKGSDNITVAVIDSGVDYNHQDLVGHIIKGPDLFNHDQDPMDTCGHGTHVSGTIGALTNNQIGVTGINWNVKILAIKTMDNINTSQGPECGGDDSMIISAMQYAADNGAKVINMSLGDSGVGCSSAYQNMVNYARSKGITIVVAAGNENTNASTTSPANCNGVITVGATGPTDTRASYSNYGPLVSISAPGGDAPCATNCILSTFPNNAYKMMGGTSMAAPHVAGAAALLLSINSSLTPDQIKDYLVRSADPISTDQPIGPRLNLAKAVSLVSGPGTSTPTPTPTPVQSGPTSVPPTETPQPSASPIPHPTESVTPAPSPDITWDITFSFNVPGIGTSAGDNNNPTAPNMPVYLTFVGEDGHENKIKLDAATVYSNGIFKENPAGGIMEGDLPQPGTYQVKISTDNTLNKLVPGFFTIASHNPTLNLPQVTLISGDMNQDGTLDLLDYNMLLSCIQQGCANNQILTDLNRDGVVDAKDLNIFLRQLEIRTGD